MEIVIILVGGCFLYAIIFSAINSANFNKHLKYQIELTKNNNKLLYEIRNLLQEQRDSVSEGPKLTGHVIDEKL